jgi:hypothetical protein
VSIEPKIATTTTVKSTFQIVLYKKHLEAILRAQIPSIPAKAELTIETRGGGSYCGDDVELDSTVGLRITWTIETRETT